MLDYASVEMYTKSVHLFRPIHVFIYLFIYLFIYYEIVHRLSAV